LVHLYYFTDVILIAVPLLQWFHESASLLPLHVHCLPYHLLFLRTQMHQVRSLFNVRGVLTEVMMINTNSRRVPHITYIVALHFEFAAV